MAVVDLARATVRLGEWLSLLASPLLLATRIYVAWQFLKSGWLKLSSWDSTVDLFREEYRVPLLSPEIAAVTGTFGELVLPALLVVGLFSRLSALGLFAVNVVAVVSYAHVLLTEGLEAALAQHVLWGFMLLVLTVFGPGRIAFDTLLGQAETVGSRVSGSRTA